MSLLPEAPVLVMPIYCRKALSMLTRHSGPVPNQEGRRDGQSGGEILPAHTYRKEEELRCGLLFSPNWWGHI
jgi:hypothetical protein